MRRRIAWGLAGLLAAGAALALQGPAFAASPGSKRSAVRVVELNRGEPRADKADMDETRAALVGPATELERLARELAEATPGTDEQGDASLARRAHELERRAREVARLARRTSRAADAPHEIERVARLAGDGAHVRPLELGGAAYLGVTLDDVSDGDVARSGLSSATGARVTSVAPDSAAARGGLAEGDVILAYAGQAVQSAAQLRRLVRETPPGRKVDLEIWRDKASRRIDVTLAERPPSATRAGALADDPDGHFDLSALPELLHTLPAWDARGPEAGERRLHLRLGNPGGPRRLGLSYQELSAQLAHYFQAPGKTGVLVSEVVADGPAAQAGVQAGDVIVAIAGQDIEDGDDLRAALHARSAGDEVELKVLRQGRSLTLEVTLGGARG